MPSMWCNFTMVWDSVRSKLPFKMNPLTYKLGAQRARQIGTVAWFWVFCCCFIQPSAHKLDVYHFWLSRGVQAWNNLNLNISNTFPHYNKAGLPGTQSLAPSHYYVSIKKIMHLVAQNHLKKFKQHSWEAWVVPKACLNLIADCSPLNSCLSGLWGDSFVRVKI